LSPKPALLKIQIDGASRGNPGPAGAGVVLSDSRGKKLKEMAVYLGESTNNVAETCALILGLQEALRLGSRRVSVLTDSQLLQRQVTGLYRVKDERLRLLHALIRPLAESFDRFEIRHVPREENRAADRLANQAVTQGLRGQLTLFEV
jgi:ribonuclease HI